MPSPDDRLNDTDTMEWPEEEETELLEPAPEEWQPERPEYQAFARYAALTREKRDLEAKIEDLNGQLEALATELKDYLGSGGWERVRVEGFTIYLRREIYARKQTWVSAYAVCAALKKSGMSQFVKEVFNSQSLSAHVRELEKNHLKELRSGEIKSLEDLLPKELAAVLNIEPSYKVIARELK